MRDGNPHAVLFDASGMRDLGTLGGQNSIAHAINASGHVVGSSATAVTTHAFLYDGVSMQDLGTLGGRFTYASHARDINDAGQVVGSSMAPPGDTHGFLWTDGRMQDLNDLIPIGSGWEIIEANGINERGQIAAVGAIIDERCTPARAAAVAGVGPAGRAAAGAGPARGHLFPDLPDQPARPHLDG